MTKKTVIVLLGVLFTSPLFSQDLEFFGYFESQLMMARIQSETLQLYSNKCRVDLKSSYHQVDFGANLNALTYHGKTEWFIPDYLPDRVVREIPETLRSYYILPFEDEIVVDNLYARFAFRKVDLTIGKQQISMGSGYVWNPTDLFNQKDLFDPTYEQPGHHAVRMDFAAGTRLNLTALYSPEADWSRSTKLLSVKAGLGRFDFTLTAIEKNWLLHDYSALSGLAFKTDKTTRRMAGLSVVGELAGLGVWFESGYNKMENEDDFSEIVTGFNYTFDFETFVMFEYYRNSLARTGSSYTLNEWMRYLASEQKALNRDQIYLMIQHPVTDLTQLGLNLMMTGDGSAALLPTLTSSPFENVELTAYANLYLGEKNTAFNKRLGNGGLIRLRVYF